MEHIFEEYFSSLQPTTMNQQPTLFSNAKVSDNIRKAIQHSSHEEYQYIHLIEQILENGVWEEGRNGRTKSIFGHSMRFSLKDGKIPILTTKKTAWKTCLKELLWFLRGETNNKILKEQGVHIWDANGSREFLDSRGLTDYEVDELGPIYGRQWRAFNKPFFCEKAKLSIKDMYIDAHMNSGPIDPDVIHMHNQLDEPGVDQLQQIIDALKDPKQRTSRRLIMTAWNPCQLDQMALPPCHILCNLMCMMATNCHVHYTSAVMMRRLGHPLTLRLIRFSRIYWQTIVDCKHTNSSILRAIATCMRNTLNLCSKYCRENLFHSQPLPSTMFEKILRSIK